MQINEVERSKEGKVSFKVTLPGKKVDEALERVYKDLVKRVNIPGFRKGKVPRKVLEVRVGEEYFQEEAKRILLEESYYEAVKKIDDKALNIDVDDVKLEVGKEFNYLLKIDTVPEIEIDKKTYTKVPVKFTEEKYTKEKSQETLNNFLRQHATYNEVKDRALEMKDQAIIDFTGKFDGEPFEGGEGKDHPLVLGSKSFIDNFEEQLVGLKIGDKKVVKVTFPEDYGKKEYAGKEAEFDVEVKNIKEIVMPEINEEFLKKIKFESEEKLVEEYDNKTKTMIENNNKVNLENKIIEKLVEANDVEAPEAMIEYLIDNQMQEFEQNMKRYFPNMKMQDYLNATGTDIKKLRDNYRESSTSQAKIELILKNIARQEKITVEEADREEKIAKMAENMAQDAKRLKEVLEMQGNMQYVNEEILMEKTMEFLKKNADIKEDK